MKLLLLLGCELDDEIGGMNPPCTSAWWIVSGVDGSREDRKLDSTKSERERRMDGYEAQNDRIRVLTLSAFRSLQTSLHARPACARRLRVYGGP